MVLLGQYIIITFADRGMITVFVFGTFALENVSEELMIILQNSMQLGFILLVRPLQQLQLMAR